MKKNQFIFFICLFFFTIHLSEKISFQMFNTFLLTVLGIVSTLSIINKYINKKFPFLDFSMTKREISFFKVKEYPLQKALISLYVRSLKKRLNLNYFPNITISNKGDFYVPSIKTIFLDINSIKKGYWKHCLNHEFFHFLSIEKQIMPMRECFLFINIYISLTSSFIYDLKYSILVFVTSLTITYLIEMVFSRKEEYKADLFAKEIVGLKESEKCISNFNYKAIEILSTHPSVENRLKNIRKKQFNINKYINKEKHINNDDFVFYISEMIKS